MKLIDRLKKLFSNPAAKHLKETLNAMSEDSLKIFAEAVGVTISTRDSKTKIISKISKVISRN
jgi:hypothetical protein